MGNPIAEALVRNRMKQRMYESNSERVAPEDIKKLETMLNYQLGDYETGVRVTGAKVVSQTPKTTTYKVDYDVDVKIPIIDPQDHQEYYENEIESRSRTITLDRESKESDVNESVSSPSPNYMIIYDGSSISADTKRIVVKDTADKVLFDKKYYAGYDYAWIKERAEKNKPFIDDLISEIASEYNVPEENISYKKGKNVFKGTKGDE